MGKPTGFLEYERKDAQIREPGERIRIFMNSKSRCLLKNSGSRARGAWSAASPSVSPG